MDTYNFGPNQIFNMNETDVSTVPNRLPKKRATEREENGEKIVSGERGVTTTLVYQWVQQAILFLQSSFSKGKDWRINWWTMLPRVQLDCVLTQSTWTFHVHVFSDILLHFQRDCHSTDERPMLSIMDNYVSHLTIEEVKFFG